MQHMFVKWRPLTCVGFLAAFPALASPAHAQAPPQAVASEQLAEHPQGEAQVEQPRDETDAEDAERGPEFVWVDGEVGYELVGFLLPGFETGIYGNGLVLGAGVGVRLVPLSLGARFRHASFDVADMGDRVAWPLWSLTAEGAFHIPLSSLDLSFGLGAGYVRSGASDAYPELQLSGLDARFFATIDYYVSRIFSVGANFGAEVMFVKQEPVDARRGSGESRDGGSRIGGALTPMLVLGLHF